MSRFLRCIVVFSVNVLLIHQSSATTKVLKYDTLCSALAFDRKAAYESVLCSARNDPTLFTRIDPKKCTPIMLAMERCHSVEHAQNLVEILLSKGVDINLQDGRGMSMLHSVVLNESTRFMSAMIQFLLSKGINPNLRERRCNETAASVLKNHNIKTFYTVKECFTTPQNPHTHSVTSLDDTSMQTQTPQISAEMLIYELSRVFSGLDKRPALSKP